MADHCGVEDPSAAASGSVSPVVQGCGDCRQLGEVRLLAVYSCPISGDADGHVSCEDVPVGRLPGSPWGSGDFFSASITPNAHVVAVVGPHGFAAMCPLQWRLKDQWSPMVDDPAVQIPLLQECVEAVRWWLQEDRWVLNVPLQAPPPFLLLHTDASLSGWGAHLLDLTALGVWSQEECAAH